MPLMATFFTLFSLSDSTFLNFNKCLLIAPSPPHKLHGYTDQEKKKSHMQLQKSTIRKKRVMRRPIVLHASFSSRLRRVLRFGLCLWGRKNSGFHGQCHKEEEGDDGVAAAAAAASVYADDFDYEHIRYEFTCSARRSMFLYPIEETAEECCY